MKKRIILREGNEDSYQYQDQLLRQAVQNRCFPEDIKGPTKDPLTGKEASFRAATTDE